MSSTLAEGREAAFEQLYRRHRGDVYRFVLRDVRNADDAEDVTQTAFLNAYRALLRGDEPEKPRAWLFTIAQNVSRRRFKALASRPREVELDPEAHVAAVLEGPTAGEIREALLRLRPNHRAAILLREVGGLSYAEMAETLGLSVSAVETLLFRARRALREELTVEERRSLRVGGFVLPLPAALSDWLGSLAGWLGRRAVTVKVAGAVGTAVLATGAAVQSGAVAMPGPGDEPGPVPRPTVRAAGDDAELRAPRPAGKPKRTAPAEKAESRTPSGGSRGSKGSGENGADVLGIRLPEVVVPELALPEASLPEVSVPDVAVPEVELPSVPAPEADLPSLPEAEALLP